MRELYHRTHSHCALVRVKTFSQCYSTSVAIQKRMSSPFGALPVDNTVLMKLLDKDNQSHTTTNRCRLLIETFARAPCSLPAYYSVAIRLTVWPCLCMLCLLLNVDDCSRYMWTKLSHRSTRAESLMLVQALLKFGQGGPQSHEVCIMNREETPLITNKQKLCTSHHGLLVSQQHRLCESLSLGNNCENCVCLFVAQYLCLRLSYVWACTRWNHSSCGCTRSRPGLCSVESVDHHITWKPGELRLQWAHMFTMLV